MKYSGSLLFVGMLKYCAYDRTMFEMKEAELIKHWKDFRFENATKNVFNL